MASRALTSPRDPREAEWEKICAAGNLEFRCRTQWGVLPYFVTVEREPAVAVADEGEPCPQGDSRPSLSPRALADSEAKTLSSPSRDSILIYSCPISQTPVVTPLPMECRASSMYCTSGLVFGFVGANSHPPRIQRLGACQWTAALAGLLISNIICVRDSYSQRVAQAA